MPLLSTMNRPTRRRTQRRTQAFHRQQPTAAFIISLTLPSTCTHCPAQACLTADSSDRPTLLSAHRHATSSVLHAISYLPSLPPFHCPPLSALRPCCALLGARVLRRRGVGGLALAVVVVRGAVVVLIVVRPVGVRVVVGSSTGAAVTASAVVVALRVVTVALPAAAASTTTTALTTARGGTTRHVEGIEGGDKDE